VGGAALHGENKETSDKCGPYNQPLNPTLQKKDGGGGGVVVSFGTHSLLFTSAN
jgi:hypothetical protein